MLTESSVKRNPVTAARLWADRLRCVSIGPLGVPRRSGGVQLQERGIRVERCRHERFAPTIQPALVLVVGTTADDDTLDRGELVPDRRYGVDELRPRDDE